MKSDPACFEMSVMIFMWVTAAMRLIRSARLVKLVFTRILFSQLNSLHIWRNDLSLLHVITPRLSYQSAGWMYSMRLTNTSFRFTTARSALEL